MDILDILCGPDCLTKHLMRRKAKMRVYLDDSAKMRHRYRTNLNRYRRLMGVTDKFDVTIEKREFDHNLISHAARTVLGRGTGELTVRMQNAVHCANVLCSNGRQTGTKTNSTGTGRYRYRLDCELCEQHALAPKELSWSNVYVVTFSRHHAT